MKTLFFIWKNLDHFKPRFCLTAFAALINGILDFYFLILITDFTKSQFSLTQFWQLAFTLIIIYGVSLILAYFVRNYGEPILKQFSNYLKVKYFQKIDELDSIKIQNTHSGYLYSIINSVASGLNPICFDLLWIYPSAIAKLTIYFFYLAIESKLVALINFAIFAFFIIVSLRFSKKMADMAKKLNIKEAKFIERLVDFMTNILTIKKLGIQNYAKEKLDYLQDINAQQIEKNSHLHALRWFTLHTIFGIAFLGTLAFFLYFISINALNPSVLILFVAALNQVKGLIERLSESVKSLLEMNTYIDSLQHIFTEYEAKKDQQNPTTWQEISLQNIVYQHPENTKSIRIKNFHIKKGEKICIYGASGQGKTTILNIIINFIQPLAGTRTIDGHNYNHIGEDFFIKKMIYVAQEVELFNMTLRENLRLGKTISDERLLRYLEELALAEWFSSLEKGFDTLIGEKGLKLSAGQKQRINILRAVLMNKDIYLFDEPTSHLDLHSEEIVIRFIEKYLQNKTLLIVTHREAIQQLCNSFYEIKNHRLLLEPRLKSFRGGSKVPSS